MFLFKAQTYHLSLTTTFTNAKLLQNLCAKIQILSYVKKKKKILRYLDSFITGLEKLLSSVQLTHVTKWFFCFD